MSGGVKISKAFVEHHKGNLVAIVAGEASADLHGANLVKSIRELNPEISFIGIGGPRMEAEGVNTLVPASDMAVVGLSEVLRKAKNIARAYFKMKTILKELKPSLLVLIDYPEFNLRIAGKAKKCGIPVMYYISPQIWAWRIGRIKRIRSVVDTMVCILPFEKKFYEHREIPVRYVGHPLCDVIPFKIDRETIMRQLGLENNYPIVGLLPGSRDQEVKELLPVMLETAQTVAMRYDNIGFVLPLAPTIKEDLVESIVNGYGLNVIISKANVYELLSCCSCALIASGTATLEAAIMGIPMVVVYKVSPLTFFLAKRLVKVKRICLVNLIAGRDVVPEIIQDEVTSENMAGYLINLIEDKEIRDKMIKDLKEIKSVLGGRGASKRAAEIAVSMIA